MQNVSPPSLRAVVYSRVSTEAQVEGTSLDHQEKESLRWCREHAAQVVDVIRDEGVSGADFLTRPGIQRALSLIKGGQANILVVYKVDRAARDLGVLLKIRDAVRRAKGKIAYSDGTIFADNPAGDAMFGMVGVMSEWERAEIAKRLKRGRTALLHLGVQTLRSRFPFGYRIVRTDDVIRGEFPLEAIGSYLIVEEQAAIVGRMFEDYGAGKSVYGIIVALNDAGIPAPRGGRWNIGTVQKILTNPVYKGTPLARRWERHVDEDRVGSVLYGRLVTKNYYYKLRDDGETIQLEAPAIVSEELWNRCQELRVDAKSRSSGRSAARCLLSTLMKCPSCGKGMTGHRTYYRCHYITRTSTHPCDYRRDHPQAACDAAVLGAVQQMSEWRYAEARAVNAYQRVRAVQQAAPSETWEKVEKDEAALAKRERATVEAQIAGIQQGADPAVYSRLFAEIAAERKRLEQRRAALAQEAHPVALSTLLSAAERIQRTCAALVRVLPSPEVPIAEKRQALVCVIRRIVPVEDGLAIHFVGLDEPVLVQIERTKNGQYPDGRGS